MIMTTDITFALTASPKPVDCAARCLTGTHTA